MIAELDDREKMIESNLGLVHSCAHRMCGRGVEYDDLFQAGCIGLIKAVDGFDKSRGFTFSTYAVPVILGEIKRIFRDGGSVKVSRTLKDKARKINFEREHFSKKNGREPSIGELAEILCCEETEIAQAINASMPVISLTHDDDDDSNSQIDIPTEPPDEMISTAIALEQVMDNLEGKDKELIKLRYYAGLTQTDIAEKLGMTQVQVSRREKVLLKQMRSKLL